MAARCALILVLFIFGAAPLAAQSVVRLGPLVGLYKGRDADGYRVIGGAALRFRLSDMIGIEGSINYRKEEYNHESVGVQSLPLMVTGLLYPVPFVYGAVGAGWYTTSVSYHAPPGTTASLISVSRGTQQQFGWHCGGGVELRAFSFVTLVGDIRYVMLNDNFRSSPGNNSVISSSPVMTAVLLFDL
jgi:opacity protein-like surface antigen